MLGLYLKPDEIEEGIKKNDFLDFSSYGIITGADHVLSFFAASPFLISAGLGSDAKRLEFSEGRLIFTRARVNSYFASVASDFLQRNLLDQKLSFTLETVMSHPSKVNLLADAQTRGYRTYLYYVATNDPAINIARVKTRVARGGHDVPADRITDRYHRFLSLLMEAIRYSNRAYIFDNSGEHRDGRHVWLAEICSNSRPALPRLRANLLSTNTSSRTGLPNRHPLGILPAKEVLYIFCCSPTILWYYTGV